MIIIIKIITAVVLLVIGIFVSTKYSNKWAENQQKSYIEKSKKMYGDSSQWEGDWIRKMFKFGFIFSVFVIAAITFSLLFGPIYI